MAGATHDRKVLREEAYADDTHLDVRYRTHQLYAMEPVDFGRWTLERVTWRGGEHVLDMGCGRGDLLRRMGRGPRKWGALVGFDLSSGMVARGIALAMDLPVCFFVGDAQSTPFPRGTFDVVMARHMLYHVPDVERAVAEAARVLRPDGCFLVTTNSAHTMPEYWALRERAAARFPAMTQSDNINERFSLENGVPYLTAHFEQVTTHKLPGRLRFPSSQPFVDYFASTRALTMRPGHTEAEWQEVLNFVRSEAEALVASHGHIDVTKVTGALVATRGG